MSGLHLVSLPIPLQPFWSWAAKRGFGLDEGLALHHLLSETFGKSALQPFRLMVASGGKVGSLYAYAKADAEALRRVAEECAMPDALKACDLENLASKSMPEVWKRDRRLAFDLKARPVKRLMKPAGIFPKGAEVDAYLAEALRAAPQAPPRNERLAREDVYREWLKERLGEAAQLDGARMVRYERHAILRGGQRREGPEVVWHGELRVLDSEKFAARLASGVGRHSAYGYGMLLLRPAR